MKSWNALPAVLHVIVPLILGALIYVLWRKDTLLVFDWLRACRLEQPTATLRQLAKPLGETLPRWVLFSLPDGLWVYATVSCMLLIWRRSSGIAATIWVLMGPFLGIASELGQLFRVVPGQFDIKDMFLYFAGSVTAVVAVGVGGSRRCGRIM
jgi:hypothetical protein